tara:strand:- start:1210 stop:1344 length:135 start_codon:yes stop_codon:yes gene_type:complete
MGRELDILQWAVANGVPDESDEEDDDFDLSDSASDKKCEKSPPL